METETARQSNTERAVAPETARRASGQRHIVTAVAVAVPLAVAGLISNILPRQYSNRATGAARFI